MSSLGTVTENLHIAKPLEVTRLTVIDAGVTLGGVGSALTWESLQCDGIASSKQALGRHPTTASTV